MPYAQNALAQHWMPFTANRDFDIDPRLLVRAQGMYYWSPAGQQILDDRSEVGTYRGESEQSSDRF